MGYQALLFCPDEKTARTVTQVLTELEFSVEPCTEAFAAVKKLMGGHFDAVVVDCDNEQNAALLFKSAKNSMAGQASLAVAVVEGQAGVAKAFRIGANLVLTKPINVEQAKGTLRVARGLLRKGDPGKAAAPVAPAAPVKSGPTISPNAVPPLGSTAPQRPVVGPPAAKLPVPVAKPAPAAIAKAPIPAPVAKIQEPVEADELEIDLDDSAAIPAAGKPASSTIASVAHPSAVSQSTAMPAVSDLHSSPAGHSGAASAPAPARIVPETEPEIAPASSATIVSPPQLNHAEAQSESAAPPSTFTFGGANAPAQSSSGGSKKVFIGVAAAMIIVGGLYFGWTQFGGKSAAPASVAQHAAPVNTTPQTSQPGKTEPLSSAAATKPAPTAGTASSPQPASTAIPQPGDTGAIGIEPGTEKIVPSKNTAKPGKPAASSVTKPSVENAEVAEEQPASQPILIKNGSKSSAPGKAAPVADTPAPSVLGSSATESSSGLPNLGANTGGPKPVLQTLNVSQGVSQGLLLKKVAPIYPATAMHMRVEGAVQLLATIGKTGNISAVKVVSGEPLLAKAAQDAVKQWKYKPYLLNGEPVEIQTQVTVNFKLPK